MPDDGNTNRGSRPTSLPLPGLSFGGTSLASQRAFENWAHGMSKLFHEMAEFMQARLLEDATMWEKLAACRDPKTALDLQRQFATKAGADYAAAGQKFARLIMEIGQNCSAGLRQTPPETD